jgi:hypothetical protein
MRNVEHPNQPGNNAASHESRESASGFDEWKADLLRRAEEAVADASQRPIVSEQSSDLRNESATAKQANGFELSQVKPLGLELRDFNVERVTQSDEVRYKELCERSAELVLRGVSLEDAFIVEINALAQRLGAKSTDINREVGENLIAHLSPNQLAALQDRLGQVSKTHPPRTD